MLYMEDLQIIGMSVDEIQKCDYSVEKYWAVTFHRAVYCAFWGGSNQAHAFDRPFNTVGVPTQPLSEREAEVDLVLIKSSFLFSRKLCLKNTSYHKNKMIYIISRKGCI